VVVCNGSGLKVGDRLRLRDEGGAPWDAEVTVVEEVRLGVEEEPAEHPPCGSEAGRRLSPHIPAAHAGYF
jgi:hypothetical protein